MVGEADEALRFRKSLGAFAFLFVRLLAFWDSWARTAVEPSSSRSSLPSDGPRKSSRSLEFLKVPEADGGQAPRFGLG